MNLSLRDRVSRMSNKQVQALLDKQFTWNGLMPDELEILSALRDWRLLREYAFRFYWRESGLDRQSSRS